MKRATLTSLIDALALLLLIFVLLPHMPKPDEDDSDAYLIRVEARWPDGWKTDVDVWVKAPGGQPVGFRRNRDGVWALERDDLGEGSHQDVGGLNLEQARARSLPAGEYIVNLHLYGNVEDKLPVPVDLQIVIRWNTHTTVKKTKNFSVELAHRGEEITVARFTIDPDGKTVQWHEPPIPKGLFQS